MKNNIIKCLREIILQALIEMINKETVDSKINKWQKVCFHKFDRTTQNKVYFLL